MKFSVDQIDIITKYASNQHLDHDESLFVETNKSTEAFQEVLTYEKALINSVTLQERSIWRKKFETIESSISINDDVKGRRAKFNRQLILILIAIILLVAGFLLTNYLNQAKANEVIFAEFYEPFPNLINSINRNINNKTLDGFQDYELGNYQNALIKLDTSNRSTDIVQFYKALCFLQLDKTNKSIDFLSEVAANENAKYQDAAGWYHVLALIKNEQMAEAEKTLVKIIDNEVHLYRNKATKLLEELKSSEK